MTTPVPATAAAATPEIAADATPAPPGGTDPDPGTPSDTSDRSGGKYRIRLREAEAERDTLRGRVETMQRAEVERIAADVGIVQPAALWASGADLAGLLDETTGEVNRDRVIEAARAAVEQLGLATRPPQLRPDLSQGARPLAKPPATVESWSEFLRK